MPRRPAWIVHATPLILGLFLGTDCVPRTSVFVHHHAGGEHEHVHPWGPDVALHDDGGTPSHHADGDGLTDVDDDAPLHAHAQSPFQHAAAPVPVRVPQPRPVAPARPKSQLAPGHVVVAPAPARAPPRPLAG
jgi:hypothetical protein